MIFEAKNYDLWSLDGARKLQTLNLKVAPGDVVFLTGENGSGKSTFLAKLFDLFSKNQSHAQSTNQSFVTLESSTKVIFMPQAVNQEFFAPMTLGDLVGKGSLSSGLFKSLLSKEIANHLWSESSGGERQRAFLAHVLSQKSGLYLLDEPFNHLDPFTIKLALEMIFDLSQKNKAAFVISTHQDVFVEHTKTSRLVKFGIASEEQ